LPDELTLPLVPAGLLATWLLDPDSLSDHAFAAAGGYAVFRAVEIAYRWARGRDGLGGGDAKLLCAAGAWVGLSGLPWVVLGASAAGLSAIGVMRLRGAAIGPATAIPFGPPLALATWLVWLYLPG